jgi:hypothetical protein
MGSHYSNAQDVGALRDSANAMVRSLMARVEELSVEKGRNVVPILYYRGYSGAALATAILLTAPERFADYLTMVYVRKENEDSHGDKIEYHVGEAARVSGPKVLMPVFVDDFISSGETYYKATVGLKKYLDGSGYLIFGGFPIVGPYQLLQRGEIRLGLGSGISVGPDCIGGGKGQEIQIADRYF